MRLCRIAHGTAVELINSNDPTNFRVNTCSSMLFLGRFSAIAFGRNSCARPAIRSNLAVGAKEFVDVAVSLDTCILECFLFHAACSTLLNLHACSYC